MMQTKCIYYLYWDTLKSEESRKGSNVFVLTVDKDINKMNIATDILIILYSVGIVLALIGF